jgi:hypothetical protein
MNRPQRVVLVLYFVLVTYCCVIPISAVGRCQLQEQNLGVHKPRLDAGR